ncbi:MAG: zinc metalloprotease HtpX [Deltaproteobacteria bacterium]|nr:MAG: zinc metalloprotease HtpX [Deltaproteobacteria bacterium]
MGNTVRTTLLLGLLTGLLLVVGHLFGGRSGMVIAFGFALVMNFGAYWFSDKIVLAMYRAVEADPSEYPELYEIVRKLAHAGGVPVPKVYIVPNPAPNAFATGRSPEKAAVAVTTGLLSLLNREEIEGVLAHELSHVKNRDTLISAVAATIAGAIMMLANMARWAAIFGIGGRDDDEGGGILGLLAVAILAPIAALIVQMAISRSREYLADESGAKLCGNPLYLASALRKLGGYAAARRMEANPSTAHMFIVNPFSGGKSLLNLFSTHPPLEERIERLERMAGRVTY